MTETHKISKGLKKKTDEITKESRKIFENTKDKANIGKLLKNFWESLMSGEGTEAFKKFGLIIAAISGKLSNLKKDVDNTKIKHKNEAKTKGTEEVATEEPEEEEEDEVEEEPEPAFELPEINVNEFHKGELFASLAKFCPYAEVKSGLLEQTKNPITVQGIPGWKKGRKTGNWDHVTAGNTNKLITEGEYKVDSVIRPKEKKEKVSEETHKKLEQICIALQHDPRMPLFHGIDMTVDDIKVTVVKEIHCRKRSQTNSTTLGQPHIGTSYIVKS